MVADSAAAIALLPPSVTEVVADKIHAIGGTIPAQQSLTWSPRRAGWLPIQCYLFQDGAESLLIDTGVAVHRAEIMRGIAALLGGRGAPRMTMTRWEPDSIINLPSVLKTFEIRSVVWSGPLNPLDFFEGIEKASIDGHLQATTGVALQREPPGSILKLGDLRLEIVKPTMNVLATYWFYETETRTLLTSDSFGYLTSPTPGGPQIAANAARDITTDGAAEFLRTKFDWMIGIDTKPLQNELLAIMRARPVDRICPGFGCIIEGPAAVAHAVDRTIEAMKLLGRERRASALAGLDWSRAELKGSGE